MLCQSRRHGFWLCSALVIVVAVLVGGVSAQCVNGTASTNNPSTCASCNAGFFGATCAPCTCSTRGGVCNGGISGDGRCSVCYSSFWGINCENVCTCRFGVCDNRTATDAGKCRSCTTTNYTGVNCDQCVAGVWGAGCRRACTCKNGICSAGLSGTGRCVSGSCTRGWYGANCDSTQRSATATLSLVVPPSTLTPGNATNVTGSLAPSAAATPAPNGTSAPPTGTPVPPPPPPGANAAAVYLVFLNVQQLPTLAVQLSSLLAIPVAEIVLTRDPAYSFGVTVFINSTLSASAGYIALVRMVTTGDSRLAPLGVTSYRIISQEEWNRSMTTTPVPSRAPETLPPAPSTGDDGLPAWGIALIAIGCIVFIAAALYCLWLLYVHLKTRQYNKAVEKRAVSFHNVGTAGRGRNGAVAATAGGGGGAPPIDALAVDLPQPEMAEERELQPVVVASPNNQQASASKYQVPNTPRAAAANGGSVAAPPTARPVSPSPTAAAVVAGGAGSSGAAVPPLVIPQSDDGAILLGKPNIKRKVATPTAIVTSIPAPAPPASLSNKSGGDDVSSPLHAFRFPAHDAPGAIKAHLSTASAASSASVGATPIPSSAVRRGTLPPAANERSGAAAANTDLVVDNDDGMYTPPEDPLDVDLDMGDDAVAPPVSSDWEGGGIRPVPAAAAVPSRIVVTTTGRKDSDEDSDIE